MEDTRTVTVTGHFGKPREVTRRQFVEIWRNHTADLYAIMDAEQLQPIVDQVVIAAHNNLKG